MFSSHRFLSVPSMCESTWQWSSLKLSSRFWWRLLLWTWRRGRGERGLCSPSLREVAQWEVWVGESLGWDAFPWGTLWLPVVALLLEALPVMELYSLIPLNQATSLWSTLCETSTKRQDSFVRFLNDWTILGCRLGLFTELIHFVLWGKMAFIRPQCRFPFELLSENWPDTHLQLIFGSWSRIICSRGCIVHPGRCEEPALPAAEPAPQLTWECRQLFAVKLCVLATSNCLVVVHQEGDALRSGGLRIPQPWGLKQFSHCH